MPGSEIEDPSDYIDRHVKVTQDILKHCTLCPRKCGIDRTAGQTGYCGLTNHAVVDCSLAHHGEEPPLSGACGSARSFSSCNLRCIFCQNYQISHGVRGDAVTSAALAETMLGLQDRKCHNINVVTPTPQAPFIIEALHLARAKGLIVPFVYNCGGYEDRGLIERLEGDVDIYLPDFKYGSDDVAFLYSGVKDYAAHALASLEEMARQVGHDLEMEGGTKREVGAEMPIEPTISLPRQVGDATQRISAVYSDSSVA